MQLNEEKIKKDFKKVKKNNPYKTRYPKNKDGGWGNTLEDLLGIRENNKKKPDYLNFECKAARSKSGAKITLSSKVATYPEKSSKFLWNKFGNVKPPENLRRFYPTLRANDNDALVYEKNYMGLKVERDTKKIRMIIRDLDKKVINSEIYWSFDDVYSSTIKLKDMLISEITEEKIEGVTKCYYNTAYVFWGFNFDGFLNQLEKGNIELEFRCGVYKDKKRYGQMHDRGPGWRLVKSRWKETMKNITKHNILIE